MTAELIRAYGLNALVGFVRRAVGEVVVRERFRDSPEGGRRDLLAAGPASGPIEFVARAEQRAPRPSRSKHRIITALQVRVFNPPIRALAARGLAPGVVLLETTGRKSGQPRRTPVSNGLQMATDTFWLIAEHGHRAAYVRNMQANPRVRVRVRGRWRTGVAHVLEDADPISLMHHIPRLNALSVRAMGSNLLAIRIDLDP